MDQTHQNLKTLTQFSKYQFLKKITQLLLSVSVFSLLLSNRSRLSFLHFFNFFFPSTVPIQLFSHTLDKNCIFLLCNGLLVFVAKLSGLISSSSSKNSYGNNSDEIIKHYEDYESSTMVLDPSKVALLEKEENIVNGGENEYVGDRQEVERDVPETHQVDEDNQEKENGFLIIEKDGKENEVSVEGDDHKLYFDDKFPVLDQEQEEQEDYEDEDEENGTLSTEELNKKFEEFIRRMKEEIRVEARQQLVMVN